MTDIAPIEQLLDRYAAAVYAKDVDAFVDVYADDVRIFDTWGQWSHDWDGWRTMAMEWFGSLGEDRVAVERQDVQVVGDGDTVAVSAFTTFKGLAADGTQLRAMDNRVTWIVRKRADGDWKVVHEHSSAPADFETGKVVLRR